MHDQFTISVKLFPTCLTPKGLCIGVPAHMLLQIAAGGEFLVAVSANMGFFALVDELVDPEIGAVDEGPPANLYGNAAVKV